MDQQTSLKMIEELSNAYGASGFEDDVLLVGRKYGEGLAESKKTASGTCFSIAMKILEISRSFSWTATAMR